MATAVPPNVIRFNMDSGCTDTTVLTFDHLMNHDRSLNARQPFSIADDRLISSIGTGTLPGPLRNTPAYVIPDFKENLLSIS